MEKIKKSLFSKISAIVLALALVMGTIPTSIIRAQAANDENGTVEVINEVGGEVNSTDPLNVQVKYEGQIVIARLGVDEEKGRESEGWYVGALMTVPTGIDYSVAQYTDGNGVTTSLASLQNLESIYMWQPVKENEYDAAAGSVLTYTWVFDWNTQDDGTVQNVVFSIDTSKVTLSDEDTVAPTISTPVVNPSAWTNGDVEITGTVNDNFSGVKAVYYKKVGTEEAQTATLTGNTYSFTISASSYEGEYVVWCEDNKGNKSDEVKASVMMDNIQPTIAAKADVTDWTNKKVTISGTAIDAESGVKAVYYQKGNESKVEITNFDKASGLFEFEVAAQEYAGDYTVSCVDAAGNESKTTVAVKMDNKVPEITDIKADITDWTKKPIVISGTVSDTTSGVSKIYYTQGESGEKVEIEAEEGAIEFKIDPQEYEGNYFVYCVDAAGNESSATVAVKMDNGECVVVTGEASYKEWTNKGVTISGTVADETSGVVSVSWRKADGSASGEAILDADTYRFDVAAQDYEGNYIITCKDKAGNGSAELNVPVKMDKTAPIVEEVPTVTPNTWTNGQVLIEGVVSDNLSGVASVTYRKADSTEEKAAALDISANTYTITLDADAYEGDYIIYCTDNAKNKSAEVTVSVKMDNIAPVMQTPTISEENWTKASVEITGIVSDELSKVKSVTCIKTGTTEKETVIYDDVTGTYSITLEAQNYYGTYTITCEDNAGNTTSTTVTVLMDTQQPELDDIEPVYNDGDWVNKAITITGKATDPNPGAAAVSDIAKVYYKKGGETDEQAKLASYVDGKFTFEIEAQNYKGTYVIYCIDNAGNRSEDSVINVYMDNEQCKILSAEVSIPNWTNKDVVIHGNVWDNLSGIKEVTYKQENAVNGETVQVSKAEGEADYTYSYSITIPAQNYDGKYILTCEDVAGNEMLEAKTVSVKMDIENPVVVEASANPSDWYNGTVTISGKVNDPVVNEAQSGVVSYTYKKGNGEESEPLEIKDGNTFSFTVGPDDYEGTYTIYCIDAAGNKSEGKTVNVKMDNIAPNGTSVKLSNSVWDKIVNVLTFKLFFNNEQAVTVNTEDNRSGIKTIEYIEKDITGLTELTEEDVKNETGWTSIYEGVEKKLESEADVTIASTPDKNVVVCVRVTDFAGNMSYVTTDGLIFDTTKPAPALQDNKLVLPEEQATQSVLVSGRPLYGIAEVGEEGKVVFDVKVTEETVDGVLQSGIQSVTYEIKAKDRATDESCVVTETGTLYTWDKVSSLKTAYDSTASTDADEKISVDATKFNYNYVDLTVKVVDNAGNETEETYEFAIDITAPAIEISYDNNKFVGYEGEGGRGYFDDERTLTVTYVERSENWNQEEANKVLAKTVAKNATGEDVAYDINWIETKEGAIADEDVHKATIKFVDEVHYNVEKPTFTDAAGNEATLTEAEGTKYPYVFSIDKFDYAKDSVAEITIKEETWLNEFLNTITFGVFDLFSNTDEEVTVKVTDDFAGIREIKYIEKEYTNGGYKVSLTEKDVREYKEWEEAEPIKFDTDKVTNKEFAETIRKTLNGKDINKDVVIFVQVIDYAGYDKVLSSDGVIIDTTKPAGELTDDKKMILPAEDEETEHFVPNTQKPLYGIKEVGKDELIVFDISISEKTLEPLVQEVVEDTEQTTEKILQSGIQKVTYKVESRDRANDVYKVTEGFGSNLDNPEEGVLYEWNRTDAVLTEFTESITVNAKLNNYNYVKVTVTVTDNAGNSYEETYEFAIDITAPTVAISYNMNTPVDEDENQGYFNCQRVATITYTERSENWSSADAEAKLVTALDINGNPVKDAYDITWGPVVPGITSNLDKHIATVSFNPTNILETEDVEIEDATESTEPVTGADARHTIDTSYTDAAGNSVSCEETKRAEGTVHPFKFTIDTVKPELMGVVYEEQIGDTVLDVLTFNMFRYFGNNAIVKITVNDETAGLKTFDFEGILDDGVSLKNKAIEKTIISIIEQTDADEKESKELTIVQQKDKSEFVIEFKIPKEILTAENSFRGSLVVNAHDYCKNTSEPGAGANTQGNESYIPNTRLVVDKIAPTCQVTFDQPVKEADGISYYDNNFTATIVIDEANFYAEDVHVLVNDTRVYPTDWKQDGDIWTSHVSFTEENDYVLKVNYEDRSGNVMTPYESNQKTLDTTEPVIAVSNLKHESANNDETIGFVLTVTDKNIALADIKPQVTAVIRKGDNSSNYTYETIGIALGTPVVSTNTKGETVYTYTVKNLEIDGYYSIVCSATDHANHTVSNIGVSAEGGRNSAVETMNFSVNREGSVFWIETEHTDKYTEQTMKDQLDGAYANDQVTVRLHEINVDKVDDSEADDKRTVLTLNDGNESNTIELVEGGSGSANYERNVSVGRGGWYKTTYTLDNEQFKNDGTYSLNIITYDKAENSNVNTKSEEGTIKFVVDRTNPVISSNVKNEQVIKENGYTVEFKVADVNLDLETVVVKLNGEEIKCKEVSTGTYQFTVDEAQWKNFPNLSQDFEIEAKDLAGNSAEIYERNKITVTDDVLIQVAAYMINHPLVLGLSATGLVALAGFFIFLIIFKRRKEEQE